MNPSEGQQAVRVAEKMSNTHFPVSFSPFPLSVSVLFSNCMFVCVCAKVPVWRTHEEEALCARTCAFARVIGVSQDDLACFSSVMFIFCLAGSTLYLFLPRSLCLCLSPSYQNPLDGLLWEPRRTKSKATFPVPG